MTTIAQRNLYSNQNTESGAAFFVGKLNKTHDREQIYSALRSLGKRYGFYINKLDMPYGDKYTKRGNKGYCFVHVRNQKEADRIVALHYIQLGNQKCEVKAYGGRNMDTSSQATSGFATPSRQTMPTEDISIDLEKALNTKINTPKKNETFASSWAEESENPESYYESSEDDFDAPETVREVEPVTTTTEPCIENIETAANSTKPVLSENMFTAENAMNFVHHHLIEASKKGQAMEFLKTYFDELERLEKNLQSMSQQELQTYAQQFVPALNRFVELC